MSSRRWKIAQAIEIRWWQYYLRKKAPETYLDWKKKYWKGFLDQINMELPSQKRILDAGCGPAGIFTILANNTVFGLDPLIQEYQTRLNHFDPENYPWVQFVDSSLEAIDTTETFDYVFCINAINHVDDWKASIQNAMELVKPGGQLILSTDLHKYKFLKAIFQYIPGDILHPQQHDINDYQQAIKDPNWIWEEPIAIKREMIFEYVVFKGIRAMKD